MTIRDIAVAFGFNVDRNSEREAQSSIKGIANLAKSLLGAIGIGFSIAGLSGLAEAAADVEALGSQFSQVFGDMEEEAAKRLQAIEDDTGVLVNRMKGSFSQIAAFAKVSGVEQAEALELSERAMVAVADSAAYYDRSIEAVTESLRSFLKGNYENDAALGLSATETTRNAAANALYGKTFKDLSEAEKQFTLLKMVEDANAASGALGQAARESDTWTNQLGNLKQELRDLKAAAGAGILKPAVSVLKILVALTRKAREKVSEFTGENGKLTRSLDRLHALVKVLKPSADRLLHTAAVGLAKGKEGAERLADSLGGMENVLKLLAVAAGSFFAVMAYAKAVATIKKIHDAWKAIDRTLLGAKLKVYAIIAVVVILALVVEDFVNFMAGNESVIGSLFDKAGIGADNARAAILDAWGKIRDFVLEVWQIIQAVLPKVLGPLIVLADAIGGALSAVFRDLYKESGKAFTALMALIKIVGGWIRTFWASWGGQILSWLSSWMDVVGNIIQDGIDILMALANFIEAVFTGDWKGAWEAILRILASIWDAALNLLSGVWETIKLLFSMGLGIILALWDKIWTAIADSVGDRVGKIYDTLVTGFHVVTDFLKSLPEQAFQWGADFIEGLVNGITSRIGSIAEAANGVGEKIRSFLHFSVPDEGPLIDYESWMPDFMSGLADGIRNNEDLVLDRIRSLASGITALTQAATAQAATAANSTVSSMTSSVTQNVNISNSYSGGSPETQRNVSKAMKKSAADATTYMARGLAYARG